jgi:GT2 family glycosyltransferase
LVTLTRFPDIFERFRASADRWEPETPKIAVTSGSASIEDADRIRNYSGWDALVGVEPFVFARNANSGIGARYDRGVLLVNDDCELTQSVIAVCEEICARHPVIGVLSPQIDGGVGNVLQRVGGTPVRNVPHDYYVSPHLAFVCVYIPARTLAAVGRLDERYTEYGSEDKDYGRRVLAAGLTLGVTPRCSVRHGFGQQRASSSFRRLMTLEAQRASQRKMRRRLIEKFGGRR